MKALRLLLAAALLAGCTRGSAPATVASTQPAAPPVAMRLGGEDASDPIAAYGNGWIPVSWSKAILAAGLPRSPFGSGSSSSSSSGVTLAGTNAWTGTDSYSQVITSTVASGGTALTIVAGAKICLNAACTSLIQDDGFGTVNITAGVNVSSTQRFDSLTNFNNTGSAGTAGSGTGITANNTGSLRRWVHKITVARTNLTAAATTQDVTVWTIPAKTRLVAMIVDGTAAFDDGAGPISALTITCGKTAGGAEYVLSGSLFTVNTLGDATGEVGASLTTYFGDLPSWSATTAVTCRFTSTGGNLSTLTTGSAAFYLEMTTYP